MKHLIARAIALAALALLLGTTIITANAEARAGGGRSMGSRGSRSYSRPASPSPQPSPYQQTQQARPATSPYQQPQPARGGFLRSMAGGLVGGMLGGMLFRSLGFGGGGGFGGGIGLFEIILLGGIAFLIYRMVKKRREQAQPVQGAYNYAEPAPYQQPDYQQPAQSYTSAPQDDMAAGLGHIRQMDASFDEQRFSDSVMDLFFKIQGAWMNRELAPVSTLLTPVMRQALQGDIDRLLREHRINRLENIAVRSVDIIEAWQEGGYDFITTRIYANLLDYTTDDKSGEVLEGSKTEPVKFEEFWTVTRPVGPNQWQLSAIDQK